VGVRMVEMIRVVWMDGWIDEWWEREIEMTISLSAQRDIRAQNSTAQHIVDGVFYRLKAFLVLS
jgi:hypothetical protein